MLKHFKKILFSVQSSRNVFYDDAPINVGCEVTIPDKYKGDQPLCVISHGSGGLGSDTQLFVDSLLENGIATLCVDSFTARNISSLGWNSTSSYISPKARAHETMQAYNFIKDNIDGLFANLTLDKIAFVGFSWGADTIAHIIGEHYKSLPSDTFYSLCYGNLWPFENSFYNARHCDVTVYHGSDDNWTSPERTSKFAKETNSEFVEFYGCTHGFCKSGYDKELLENVIINYHADFPVPTEMNEVYFWVQQGKVWKDTEWKSVDVEMTFDPMATDRVIKDIVGKLI